MFIAHDGDGGAAVRPQCRGGGLPEPIRVRRKIAPPPSNASWPTPAATAAAISRARQRQDRDRVPAALSAGAPPAPLSARCAAHGPARPARRTSGRSRDAVGSSGIDAPAQRLQARDIEQLARRAIRLAGIPAHSRPRWPTTRCTSSASSRMVRSVAATDVDEGRLGTVPASTRSSRKRQAAAQVVDMEELAPHAPLPHRVTGPWPASLASWNLRIIAGSTCEPVRSKLSFSP
jgi:hypothetical protein